MSRRIAFLPVAFAIACTGTIGDLGDRGAERGNDAFRRDSVAPPVPTAPSDWRPGEAVADPKVVGPRPLARLTRDEYQNVARDLLNVILSSEQRDLLPSDIGGSSGFATSGVLSDLDVDGLSKLGEQLAAATRLATVTSCDTARAGEEPCGRQFIQQFGRRAYRRPLLSAEIDNYFSLYSTQLRGELAFSHDEALRGVLEAMLLSPAFLYHWELDDTPPAIDTDGVIPLTGHEVASRLSFFLWGSMPDAELFAAADAGELATTVQIRAQARRLIASDRAHRAVNAFFSQWLGLTEGAGAKSPERYPNYTPELGTWMGQEVLAFGRHVVLGTNGTLTDLLTSPSAFVNGPLATVYGVSNISGDNLVLTSLDPATRPGILTRAGFLAATSNAFEGDPTKRGVIVRKRVLCQSLNPPPANIPPLPPPSPNATVRERHEEHFKATLCNGCHRLTDHVGFGFGNFDAIGAYQTMELGRPIDAKGQVMDIDGRDVPFSNVAELADILAGSTEVRACLARQILRFALGREEKTADDHSLQTAYATFDAANFELKELMIALAETRSFLHRAPSAGEVTR